MDYQPPMLAPSVPTMVWGGQIGLMARTLGVELDEIRETVARRPLEHTVSRPVGGRHRLAGGRGTRLYDALDIPLRPAVGKLRAGPPPPGRSVVAVLPAQTREWYWSL
jgi:hypothetical protein